ncbi:uncharacterized protein LOC109596002 isoform X2 [Aethina tumida]|uniref:uncharacterized protein LOC109596002 isoform X2 n=1 Tax=Aethina tumida TaxID=116153 RepID=UPI002148C386|nr:uncharacterized protein LOC109596002 isoform X2 [Aethina tumida]
MFKQYILLVATAAVQCTLPNYIKVCQSNDVNLDSCIINSIEELRPKLKEGIEELNVPPIEPLLLDEIQMRSGPRTAKIDANITNLKVWGASDFKILSLKPVLEKNKFMFKATIPSLYFEGDYDVDLNLLLLKFQGKGPITGNLTDYTFDCVLRGKRITRNDKQYLEFKKMAIHVHIGANSVLKMGNIFAGDPQIAKATNEVISENSDLFLEEIRPVLENSLAVKFTNIANQITKRFTYDELFP